MSSFFWGAGWMESDGSFLAALLDLDGAAEVRRDFLPVEDAGFFRVGIARRFGSLFRQMVMARGRC
jgi:hypothetical protein